MRRALLDDAFARGRFALLDRSLRLQQCPGVLRAQRFAEVEPLRILAAELVEFGRVPYDIETTQRKIVSAGLPDMLAYRLTVGK